MGLSAVILTKNEEANIARCLDAIKDLVDEIIIVDDHSKDQTTVIASQQYHAKIITHPLDNQFDRQRNIGLQAASHEWVLQMDADEVIPQLTALSIKNAITQGAYDGFMVLRRDCVFNVPLKHVGGCYQLKLFKKANGSYKGAIHEAVSLVGKVGRIEEQVLHYAIPSIQAMVAKHNFYTELECAKYLQENPMASIKDVKKQLGVKTIKVFFKHYVRHKGYRDGIYGLVWSIIHTLHPVIFWLKVLEALSHKGEPADARRH